MGPDEFPTREELGLIFKFMLAKFREEAKFSASLCGLLQDKGLLTNEEIISLAKQLADSEQSKKAAMAYEKIKEFAAIHKIARQYLDPPSE